jgi:hypothetical protein
MMEINALPRYDWSDNPTGCCPRFNPDGWDEQELHFKDKLFVKATTRSLFHIPINIGSVFPRTFRAIEQAGAKDDSDFIVLSHDPSAWKGEHYFSVCRDIPGQDMIRLNGDYLTKVFEGPFKDLPHWKQEMKTFVQQRGKTVSKIYFFYTTCPRCAKYYGKNYVVAVAKVVS